MVEKVPKTTTMVIFIMSHAKVIDNIAMNGVLTLFAAFLAKSRTVPTDLRFDNCMGKQEGSAKEKERKTGNF